MMLRNFELGLLPTELSINVTPALAENNSRGRP